MVDSMLELLPNAGVYHIGMYKQNQTAIQYYNRLPRECNADVAYVLDPLLASAKTMGVVVSILKKVRFFSSKQILTIQIVGCTQNPYSDSDSIQRRS